MILWLESHVKENNRQEAPTKEQLEELDCLKKDLDLFETMCRTLNIPIEVKKTWARRRLMPWFRANMTARKGAHVKENNRQEAPTKEHLEELDCLKDIDLSQTRCKILNVPMEVKRISARRRLMPWFIVNMTA